MTAPRSAAPTEPTEKPRPEFSRPPLFVDEQFCVSERLDVQIRWFGALTVLTPTGVLGQPEWRQLTATIGAISPERLVVLDLILTSDVTGPVLLTMLAASRRRRPGGGFLMANDPLTRRRPGARRMLRRRGGDADTVAVAPTLLTASTTRQVDSNAPRRVAGHGPGVPNQKST